MADWFYSSKNKPMGPVSQAELKSLAAAGKLKASDLVWTDGMADWARADKVSGLGFSAPQGPAFAVHPGSPAPTPAGSKWPLEPDVDVGRPERRDDADRSREERSRRLDDDDDEVPRRR